MAGVLGKFSLGSGHIITVAATALTGLLLAGCMVGPDFERPEAPYLGSWSKGAGLPVDSKTGFTTRSQAVNNWWTLFKDPALTSLIDEAYKQNVLLEAAGVRVYQARAQLGIAKGELFPQQQQVGAGVESVQLSENEPLVRDIQQFIPLDPNFTRYSTGFDAGWEIDLWGKIRRDVQSARANLLYQIASYDDALVTLTGDIAATYVTIRELQGLIAITRRNLALQKESLDIAKVKLEGGTTTRLDVDEATASYNSTLATLPGYEAELAQAMNAMSVLLGETPGKVAPRLKKYKRLPRVPATVAVGVPADMLRRRPDIRAAEYMAAAQSAQIGVAKADLYPAFTISGAVGLKASDFSGLFNTRSFEGFINPAFSWNFLNYGRIQNNVRVQDAEFQETLLQYKNTVLNAYSEVETALVAFVKSKKQAVYLSRSVAASKSAEAEVLEQYRDGTASYDRVLDAQRSLLNSEARLLAARANVLTNLISVYKGLAGGWIPPNVKGFISDKTRTQMEDRTNWGRLLEKPVEPKATPTQ
ncbi:efflux transporter outer membrane subunit [Hoeflea sp. TYP-13]|uniref:efflux transporter outer membrane subunit n=1 Tax=Hoeflea sp. TYP-13 TaxID=3230023 RepID=UPI0034C5D40A